MCASGQVRAKQELDKARWLAIIEEVFQRDGSNESNDQANNKANKESSHRLTSRNQHGSRRNVEARRMLFDGVFAVFTFDLSDLRVALSNLRRHWFGKGRCLSRRWLNLRASLCVVCLHKTPFLGATE